MALTSISHFLFKPKVSGVLTALDDPRSMVMVASRDVVEGFARGNMEKTRGRHGAREAYIEEFLTTLVWGFGIGAMQKLVYNPFAKRFLSVKHPDMIMSLYDKGPQQNTVERIQKYAAECQKEELLQIALDPKKQRLYRNSNNLKFLVSTLAPILLLVFGVTQFNQWLTRRKVRAENGGIKPLRVDEYKLPSDTQALSTSAPNVARHYTALGMFPTYLGQRRALSAANPAAKNYAALGMFPTYLDPSPASTSPQKFSFQKFSSQKISFRQPLPKRHSGDLKFGNAFSQSISMFLGNERMNTIIVDSVITGGRVVQARNRYERIERVVMEIGKLFGFYFLADLLQRMITPVVDRMLGTVSSVPFEGLKTLHDMYRCDPQKFLKDYHQNKGIFDALPSTAGLTKQQAKKVMDAFEEKFTTQVLEYVKNQKTNNLFFELGKRKNLGWIPTVVDTNGKLANDRTRRIDFENLKKMRGLLADVVEKVETKQAPFLRTVLEKSVTGRFTTFVSANVLCVFFLAIMLPLLQQNTTFLLTGKRQFPGIMGLESNSI